MSKSVLKRFVEKIEHRPDSDCFWWTGCVDSGGYGRFRAAGRQRAHQFAFFVAYGHPPEGMQIDHICRNRSCVNPLHLRPLTLVENVLCGEGISARNLRKTHCFRDHALAGYNVIRSGGRDGMGRKCRTCQNALNKAYRARKKLAAA